VLAHLLVALAHLLVVLAYFLPGCPIVRYNKLVSKHILRLQWIPVVDSMKQCYTLDSTLSEYTVLESASPFSCLAPS
jgi:hypothetical protein